MNRFALCLVVCAFPCALLGGEAAPPSGWHLIWSDEFDGETVDLSKWRIEDAALVKNEELQYYTPEEVSVSNGLLVIRSQERAMGGRSYVSGLVDSRGRFSTLYGRIEIRAKLPSGQGLWPAHWMLPADGRWPPEIDIMEVVGSQPNNVIMSLHNGKWPALESQTQDFTGPNFSSGFHTFAVEWTPDKLRWLVDGQPKFSTADSIPSIPFYIILNTAVGGTMPGDPDESTHFPQYHYIDYVRVYAQETPGITYLTAVAENGRIESQPTGSIHKTRSAVTLKAVPSVGFMFAGWEGDLRGSQNPAILTMDAHKNVKAVFKPDPNAPRLLSQGRRVTVSSEEKGGFTGDKAVDGRLQTRWSTAFSDPQWICVDLGKEMRIEAVQLHWETACASRYELQTSNDGKKWTVLHAQNNGQGQVEEISGLNGLGRYVRLWGLERATDWGYSLWEFEVYGRDAQANDMPER